MKKRLEVIDTELMEFEKESLFDNSSLTNIYVSEGYFYIPVVGSNEIMKLYLNAYCEKVGAKEVKFRPATVIYPMPQWDGSFERDVEVFEFDSDADEAAFTMFFHDGIIGTTYKIKFKDHLEHKSKEQAEEAKDVI